MSGRRKRGDETWNRLLNWTEALKASERLAGHILAADGYVSIDPSHPLGGPDGLKDIVCVKDNIRWVAACNFPNGERPFSDTKAKFEKDIKGVSANDAQGFVFVVNQYLTIGERDELKAISNNEFVVIIHLERIVNILNNPAFYGIRLEFLDIEMTKEEQVAFFGIVTNSINNLHYKIQLVLNKLNDPGLTGKIPTDELTQFKQILESIVGNSYFVSPMFAPPITKLRVPMNELREFEDTLNRITGGPYSFSYFTPPIKKLNVPLYELQEYEQTLNRILHKLEQAKRLSRSL